MNTDLSYYTITVERGGFSCVVEVDIEAGDRDIAEYVTSAMLSVDTSIEGTEAMKKINFNYEGESK